MRHRDGLTRWDVLMVVAVVVGSAFLTVLAGNRALTSGTRKAKTQAILAAVRKGIELTIANRSGVITPIEHPFAGSNAPRWRFVRVADGSAVAAEGEALLADPLRIGDADARTRVLTADDIYADERLPLLFGLPRSRIGILGTINPRVSKARRLPTDGASLAPPYDDSRYPGFAWPALAPDSKPVPEYEEISMTWMKEMFGSSSVLGELAGLALWPVVPRPRSSGSRSRRSTTLRCHWPMSPQTGTVSPIGSREPC